MQQGGSQYGVPPPEMTAFAATGAGTRAHLLGISGSENPQQQQQQQQQLLAEAASPISSRPPQANFDELVPTPLGNFPDEDTLAPGEEAALERGAPSNRWPRQETLALLKIRSEMDAVFQDATLKGPLWEDVSRKLAELGYTRSAKKCKEKFENVHKYYKRTKEGRAGRQDGKSYRFFSQLEALHSSSSNAATPMAATAAASISTLVAPAATATTSSDPFPSAPIGIGAAAAGTAGRLQPTPLSSIAPAINAPGVVVPDPMRVGTTAAGGIAGAAAVSFSSNTSSSSASESEEGTEEGLPREGLKRKRGGGGGGSGKMMAFFEGLMKQVMERQEAMQQRFLDTIEKREQDRMIREEAWKRQETARLNREHEIMAQERAISASRDAAIIAFLQKITGQTIQLPAPPPSVTTIPTVDPPPPPPPQPQSSPSAPPPPQQQQQLKQVQQHPPHHHQSKQIVQASINAPQLELVPIQEAHESGAGGSMDPASSRWPKSEVHALIKLRSGLESRYQEAGPKGPLWEEISAGMQRMGYNRSTKRCKEKWENINKYFKKVKESNKKRPEDAKTCPYFHQLDALYRKKVIGSGSGSGVVIGSSSFGSHGKQEQVTNPNPNPNPNPYPQERIDVLPLAVAPLPPPPPSLQEPHMETKSDNGSNNNRNAVSPDGNGGSGLQIQTSNGGLTPSFIEEGTSSGGAIKKPEDIVNELTDQHHQHHQQAVMDDYNKSEELDSDNVDDEDNDEDGKMAYEIQFHRQNVDNGTSEGGSGGNQSAAVAG